MSEIISVINNLSSFYSTGSLHYKRILEAEKQLGLSFNKYYCQYVKNYGSISCKGHELTGICKAKRLNVVDVTIRNRAVFNDIPDGWYVIEEAHIDGIVIWQSSNGSVYQTMPGYKPEKIANSLAEYISM